MDPATLWTDRAHLSISFLVIDARATAGAVVEFRIGHHVNYDTKENVPKVFVKNSIEPFAQTFGTFGNVIYYFRRQRSAAKRRIITMINALSNATPASKICQAGGTGRGTTAWDTGAFWMVG